MKEEEKAVGVVSFSVYREYWAAIGLFLAPLILLSLSLMQGVCEYYSTTIVCAHACTHTHTHTSSIHTQHPCARTTSMCTHNIHAHTQHPCTHTTSMRTHNIHAHTQHPCAHTTSMCTHNIHAHTEYTCTHITKLCVIGSRNASDWWLSYWITHGNDSTSSNNSAFTMELNSNDPSNSSDDLRFYLGIYGGLAASNTVSAHMAMVPGQWVHPQLNCN